VRIPLPLRARHRLFGHSPRFLERMGFEFTDRTPTVGGRPRCCEVRSPLYVRKRDRATPLTRVGGSSVPSRSSRFARSSPAFVHWMRLAEPRLVEGRRSLGLSGDREWALWKRQHGHRRSWRRPIGREPTPIVAAVEGSWASGTPVGFGSRIDHAKESSRAAVLIVVEGMRPCPPLGHRCPSPHAVLTAQASQGTDAEKERRGLAWRSMRGGSS
jgi:hypothetical protein